MRLIGRRGLVAGVMGLVGAGVAKLAGPQRADAAINNVQTDVTAFSTGDSAIFNQGTGASPNVIGLNNNFPAIAAFASRVSNSTTVGRFGVLGSIGVANPHLQIPDTLPMAGVWGLSLGNDGAFGLRGEAVGTGAGVYATGRNSAMGIWADATTRVGIFGTSTGTVGIFGVSSASSPSATPPPSLPSGVAGQGFGRIGVQGLSDSAIGVQGESTSGIGIFGKSPSAAGVSGQSTSAPGVFGTSTTAFGVQGASQNAYGVSGNSTTQAGVWGSSNSNVGVLGSSTSGVGVNGVSVSSNGVNALSTSGIGIYAASPSGQAGRFEGDVVIVGNLTVSGTFPHTAAVPSSDGSLRRMYSPQSAEAYYEDFGQGNLTNGVGTVTLDPDFAALILGDTYHVFLTPRGDCNTLYVSAQTSTSFEVRESKGGTSSVGFSYRLLARPKTGSGTRLDRVTIPTAPAQPKLDRVEPLDVPTTLRDVQQAGGSNEPSHARD